MAQFFQKLKCLRQVFATGVLSLEEIRNGVQTKPVHAKFQPIVHNLQNLFLDPWIVIVQVGLVRVEAMPVVSFRNWIPSPIGRFEILEDNPNIFVFVRTVAPNVEVSPDTTRW